MRESEHCSELFAFAALTIALEGCAAVQGQAASDHFDGSRFSNEPGVPSRPGVLPILKWKFSRRTGPAWPGFVEAPPGPPPPERVADLRVTFVGHSTVLVQQDGVNILTDPVWSPRIGPVPRLGVARKRPPGIRFEDLPPIDVVLLSHDHFDHLDLPTLRQLSRAHPKVTIITGLGHRELLESSGVRARVIELDWWQSATVRGLEFVATPAAHWSGRQPFSQNEALWAGFVIRGPAGVTYFAGDTGWGPHFQEIRDRFGPPRLALIPIGAYKPEWFMSPQHIGPKEAFEAARLLGAATSVAIHFGTFDLADDGQDEAPKELALLRDSSEARVVFDVLQEGEGREIQR